MKVMNKNESDSQNIKMVDTTYFSIGFPNEDWNEIIYRENYISQINDWFSREKKIIFIEGDEDAGKTTLCAQFARKYINNTLTVFFNPFNKLDYKLEFLYTNIVEQIRHILGENNDLNDPESYFTIDQYRQYIFKLRKFFKKKDDRIILIIDGLETKTCDYKEFLRELFETIPIGQEIFRFIISGNFTDFHEFIPLLKSTDVQPISLAGFSTHEMISYLGLEERFTSEISDLFKITNGLPGRLKTLKRLIKSENYSIDKIDVTTTYKKWIEMDCELTDLVDPKINFVLSLIALQDRSFEIGEISSILSVDKIDIEKTLKKVPIIEVNGNLLAFVSSHHKRYFANKLRGNKKNVEDALLDFYAREDTVNSKFESTKLFAERDNWDKVLNIVDDNYIKQILEKTEALQKVNDSIEFGIKAAEKTSEYTSMWRYSIQGSIVNELDNFLFWESEVKARISLRDFEGAISLAESAVLKVDRIRLLALIARRQKDLTKSVDEDLVNLIRDLYAVTDISGTGEKIYEIVTDLIYALPSLALEIIEKSSGKINDKSINDWVIAKLSLAAIDSSGKDDEPEKSRKLEAVQSINHPSVRKIHQAISFLVGNYTPDKVLQEVKKLPDSTERLRLLRLWLGNSSNINKDVDKVIEKALDELVSATSESMITLEILKELSDQLPFVKSVDVKRRLVERFQSIEDDLKNIALSKVRFTYKLNIFHAKLTISLPDADRQINNIITEVDDIQDTLIKVEAYSEIYSKLKAINNRSFSNKTKYVYEKISSLAEKLYEETANHYKLSQVFLRTISRRNPTLGLKICRKINTSDRRDKTRLLILDTYLLNNQKHISLEVLKDIEQAFESDLLRSTIYNRILERFAVEKVLTYDTIDQLYSCFTKTYNTLNATERLLGQLLFYRIISKDIDWKAKLSLSLESKILETWRSLEADWERIDNGFNICSELSSINESFAKQIFNETETLKKESWLDSWPVAYTYINTLKLVIRAYKGLLVSRNEEKEDLKTITTLISRIPSQVNKLRLWTEVGFTAYITDRHDIMRNTIDSHVLPLLQDMFEIKHDFSDDLNPFTLLHIDNPELSLNYIKRLPKTLQEQIYYKICYFYLHKQNPFDVYDLRGEIKYAVNFSELSKTISVLNNIETDSIIYSVIDSICKAIKDCKEGITKPQVVTLIGDIKRIIDSKLPDTMNIRHEGYKLIANARLFLVDKQNQNWSQLISQINKIPNKSDKLFIKAVVIDDFPSDTTKSSQGLRKSLIDDVFDELKSLRIHYEYVQRVIDLSDIMYKVDRNRWKEVVKRAFSLSNDLELGNEIYTSQKNILDSIYRFDPEFAKSLVKTLDPQNSVHGISRLIQDHLDSLEIANKIRNSKSLGEKEKENYRLIVKGILSAVRSLNSNKVTTKKISEVAHFLVLGNKLPLHEVFPVYMFYLANCSNTYRATHLEGKVANIHRDNFKEIVNSIDFIQLLSQRKKIHESQKRNFQLDKEFSTNKPINPRSREEAINFIRTWIIDEAERYIYFIDPYFQMEDLEFLKFVLEKDKSIEVEILGSKDGLKQNIEDEYKDYWRMISDENAPFTNITFYWYQHDNKPPIHDRWIITQDGGLRLGTSLNSIGKTRESEISIMPASESDSIAKSILNEYLMRRKREINRQRLSYKGFSL